MTNIITINCRDHHYFTEYITNAIVEIPRRKPVDNGYDLYIGNTIISVRLTLFFYIAIVTDSETTKLILPIQDQNSKKVIDRFIDNYSEPQFITKQSYIAKYRNTNKTYTTKISADMYSFMEYMDNKLRYAESKADKVYDFVNEDLQIAMRYYNQQLEHKFFITYVKKTDSSYFEINVVETNSLPKQSSEADKTPTRTKIEALISDYFNSQG